MAMVRITNGKDEMTISKSVFHQMYERLGWKIKDESTLTSETTKSNKKVVNNPEEENESEENVETTETSNDDGELTLEEKPLKEMSLEELKEYAKLKNIDIEGLDTSKEIKKAIRKGLETEE